MPRSNAFEMLVDRLERSPADHRLEALWALEGFLGTRWRVIEPRQLPRALRIVTGLLEADPSSEVREAAAYMLHSWAGTAAAPALLRALDNGDEAPRVRAFAAEGLAYQVAHPTRHGHRAWAEESLRRALDDESAEVRFWALFAVGQLEMKSARPRIEELAKTDGAKCPHMWLVKDEAADVLTFWDEGEWPDRTPEPDG